MSRFKTASRVPLSEEVLEDVNVFEKDLTLRKSRCKEVPCFSDPVRQSHICNPEVMDAMGQKGIIGETTCRITWSCHCYFAARLGIGLATEEPYNFKKSLKFVKGLSYNSLCEAIDRHLVGEVVDEAKLVADSKAELQREQEVRVSQKQEVEGSIKNPSKKSAKKISLSYLVDKSGYGNGTIAYDVLRCLWKNLGNSVSLEDIEGLLKKKGRKRTGKVSEILDACVSKGVIEKQGENLYMVR